MKRFFQVWALLAGTLFMTRLLSIYLAAGRWDFWAATWILTALIPLLQTPVVLWFFSYHRVLARHSPNQKS